MKFKPNIGARGRILRAVLATLLLVAGIFLPGLPVAARIAILLSSAFVFFEALRGWCALRACGIKTKI